MTMMAMPVFMMQILAHHHQSHIYHNRKQAILPLDCNGPWVTVNNIVDDSDDYAIHSDEDGNDNSQTTAPNNPTRLSS